MANNRSTDRDDDVMVLPRHLRVRVGNDPTVKAIRESRVAPAAPAAPKWEPPVQKSAQTGHKKDEEKNDISSARNLNKPDQENKHMNEQEMEAFRSETLKAAKQVAKDSVQHIVDQNAELRAALSAETAKVEDMKAADSFVGQVRRRPLRVVAYAGVGAGLGAGLTIATQKILGKIRGSSGSL